MVDALVIGDVNELGIRLVVRIVCERVLLLGF